jgi:hypothetical protein
LRTFRGSIAFGLDHGLRLRDRYGQAMMPG